MLSVMRLLFRWDQLLRGTCHRTSLLHIWPPKFSYVIGVTKQIDYIVILITNIKGSFGNTKWL
jgi:hypothetical protein